MATEQTSLLLLLNWMSPTFPIGSFAYSHGFEQAIVDGRVKNQDDVEDWLSNLLRVGSGWNDAVLFSLSWASDAEEVNALALALAGSAERYIETTHLGRNFNFAAAVWTKSSVADDAKAYPVAVGLACAQMDIPKELALIAFLQCICSALVSVAVRLVPLGQTSGLKVLRNLSPLIAETAKRAVNASIEDLGSHCIAAEIAAMNHETLEPRIFRT